MQEDLQILWVLLILHTGVSGSMVRKLRPRGVTFTTAKGDYTADSPLQESGLLGLVTLPSTR